MTDGRGRPLAFELTPAQRGDVRGALPLLEQVAPGRLCLADAAYDAKTLRQFLLARGTLPVIPNNPTRKHPHPFDDRLYRLRNRIERSFGQLKDWRRIATRYDKLSATFASAVALACVILWWC